VRNPPHARRNGPAPRTGAYLAIVAVVLLGFALLAVYLSSHSPNANCPCAPLGPIGIQWGEPVNATGSTPAGCPVASGHYCYTVEVTGSGGDVLSELELSLRSSAGGPLLWPAPPATDSVSIGCSHDTVVCGEYNTTSASWTPGSVGSFGGDSVVIYTPGVGAAYGLSGDELVGTYTTAGYSGTTPSNPFP